MPAYWIANVTVTDEESYAKYAQLAGQIIPAHGGEFLARGGRYRQMEGREHARNVLARFPSFEAAVGCYESAEYQEALKFAAPASDRDIVIVEG
ncbi:MAG: DUF1330 domain-containing protein [Pseudomonadota bacterium]